MYRKFFAEISWICPVVDMSPIRLISCYAGLMACMCITIPSILLYKSFITIYNLHGVIGKEFLFKFPGHFV